MKIDRLIHPQNLQKIVIVAIGAMLVCLTVSALAVTLAYQANARSSKIAVEQAHLAQQVADQSKQQSQFISDVFCQLVTPLAESPQTPPTPFGQKIKSGSVNANEKLACAPTPTQPDITPPAQPHN